MGSRTGCGARSRRGGQLHGRRGLRLVDGHHAAVGARAPTRPPHARRTAQQAQSGAVRRAVRRNGGTAQAGWTRSRRHPRADQLRERLAECLLDLLRPVLPDPEAGLELTDGRQVAREQFGPELLGSVVEPRFGERVVVAGGSGYVLGMYFGPGTGVLGGGYEGGAARCAAPAATPAAPEGREHPRTLGYGHGYGRAGSGFVSGYGLDGRLRLVLDRLRLGHGHLVPVQRVDAPEDDGRDGGHEDDEPRGDGQHAALQQVRRGVRRDHQEDGREDLPTRPHGTNRIGVDGDRKAGRDDGGVAAGDRQRPLPRVP